ncbi:TPA: hypothetical protein DE059_00065 [Candidatus Peribacteria bacterium]|nr:hypothetical protein [Candidatus Peribacteria bacterium]
MKNCCIFSCCPKTPVGIAGFLVRISFGLSLLFVGLTHYMTFDGFKGMVADGLGPLEPLGVLWALILPALMIVGGALLVANMYKELAAWTGGLALASIPAGMLAKPVLSGASLADMMPAALNAMIWLILFLFVVKCSSCYSGGSCEK